MRVAICNETFPDWTWERTCDYVASLGYQGVEIAPFTLAQTVAGISSQRRSEIRRAAKNAGLEIVGLHWLLAGTAGLHVTDSDPTIHQTTIDYFHQLIDLCHDLGGSLMVLGSPQQRNVLATNTLEQATASAGHLLQEISPHLERCNVVLCLEPLGPEEGNFLNTAQQAIALIQQVDSPQVRLHLDVKAMSTEARSMSEIIHSSRDYLHHFHANDPNRQGPGMGEVDFVPILQALQEVGYEGWLSVEVFDYSPGPETLATRSLEYLQTLIQ